MAFLTLLEDARINARSSEIEGIYIELIKRYNEIFTSLREEKITCTTMTKDKITSTPKTLAELWDLYKSGQVSIILIPKKVKAKPK